MVGYLVAPSPHKLPADVSSITWTAYLEHTDKRPSSHAPKQKTCLHSNKELTEFSEPLH